MNLSVEQRKILWSKAGNHCSYSFKGDICNKRLVENVNGIDSVVGFEAHIIGPTLNSPRYLEGYPKKKLDTYQNAILVCGSHHELIDKKKNEHIYTLDVVRRMKKEHEWAMDKKEKVLPETVSRRDNFQRLYNRFEDPHSPNLGIELQGYLKELRQDIFKVFSMRYDPSDSFLSDCGFYWNDLWSITIIQVQSGYILLIDDNVSKERYDYHHPEENKYVLYNWLDYYKERCEKFDITIF